MNLKTSPNLGHLPDVQAQSIDTKPKLSEETLFTQQIERNELSSQSVSRRTSARAIEWVGMESIDLQIGSGSKALMAKANLGVSLADLSARGIHMSRLYGISQDRDLWADLSPRGLLKVCDEMLKSQEGLTSKAKLVLDFRLPMQRRSVSGQGEGLKIYPVKILAVRRNQSGYESSRLVVQIKLLYSSTCPQSKALSEFVLIEKLKQSLSSTDSIEDVVDWIQNQGLPATPHAQRSELLLNCQLSPEYFDKIESLFSWVEKLVDELEEALKTPVQTWVKKADEMQFAVKNAENPKFCEDAARTILRWFQSPNDGSGSPSVVGEIAKIAGKVAHLESLHPFNAVAKFSASKG